MGLKNLFRLALVLTLVAGVSILYGLRSYQVFTQEQLVAVVRCEAAEDLSVSKGVPHRFVLLFSPVSRGGHPLPAKRFILYGDQWMVSGEILKWHPWLNLMGFKTCHRLSRLSGRYLKPEAEHNNPKTVYELNGDTPFIWRGLERVSRFLPLVEAVYGNAAYISAQPGTQWGVYVTLSGYLVKPVRMK